MEGHKPHAGWYYDPEGRPGTRRYWDGERWTDQYQQFPDTPSQPSMPAPERRYASLRTIAGIYQVLAWVIAVIGGIGVIVIAASTDNGGLVFIVGAVYLFFIVLTMLAFAAFIRLMLSVEESSRTTAQAVVALRDARAS